MTGIMTHLGLNFKAVSQAKMTPGLWLWPRLLEFPLTGGSAVKLLLLNCEFPSEDDTIACDQSLRLFALSSMISSVLVLDERLEEGERVAKLAESIKSLATMADWRRNR